jgi:serine protease Do
MERSSGVPWAAAVALLLAGAGAEPPPSPRITPTVRAVATALPSVVNISTHGVVTPQKRRDPYAQLIDEFFGGRRQDHASALGSGLIVDSHGLVLTNEHVIRRASGITVTLADGSNYDAYPVAVNEAHDLALLRLKELPDETPLQSIKFARPDDLYLGEPVISVGNPFGLGHSVSVGVLSATGRRIDYQGEALFDDMLQTDAAINSGNSGGPLLNAEGALIGVSLAALQRDATGIGFAIPLKRIEEVLGTWMIPSRFALVSCGLVPGTEVLEDGKTRVVVRELLADSPAAAAGLAAGDVISHVNSTPVQQAIEVGRVLWRLTAGDALELTLADGREVGFEVQPVARLSGDELARRKLGVEVQEVTPRLARAMGLPHRHGLVVSAVEEGGILGRRGVQRGDVIVMVGEVPVTGFTDLIRALQRLHHGDVATVLVHRVTPLRGPLVTVREHPLTVPF